MEWTRPQLSRKYTSPLLNYLAKRCVLIKEMRSKRNFCAAYCLVSNGVTGPSAEWQPNACPSSTCPRNWRLHWNRTKSSRLQCNATRSNCDKELLLETKVVIFIILDKVDTIRTLVKSPSTFPGNNPSKSSFRATSSKPVEKNQLDPLSVSGCFNCSSNHLSKDWTLPLNRSKMAARKLE